MAPSLTLKLYIMLIMLVYLVVSIFSNAAASLIALASFGSQRLLVSLSIKQGFIEKPAN